MPPLITINARWEHWATVLKVAAGHQFDPLLWEELVATVKQQLMREGERDDAEKEV